MLCDAVEGAVPLQGRCSPEPCEYGQEVIGRRLVPVGELNRFMADRWLLLPDRILPVR